MKCHVLLYLWHCKCFMEKLDVQNGVGVTTVFMSHLATISEFFGKTKILYYISKRMYFPQFFFTQFYTRKNVFSAIFLYTILHNYNFSLFTYNATNYKNQIR